MPKPFASPFDQNETSPGEALFCPNLSVPMNHVQPPSPEEMIVESSSAHGTQHNVKRIIVTNSPPQLLPQGSAAAPHLSKDDSSYQSQSDVSRSTKRLSQRRSSDAYPFSDSHLRRHQSNVDTGYYEVKNFEEHLVLNLVTDKQRVSRSDSSSISRAPEAHPQMLKKREKRGHGRSNSQPHMPALLIPEERRKKSAYSEGDPNEPIKTHKVDPKKHKERRKSFFGSFICN